MGFGKDGKGVIITESRVQALGSLANEAGILIGTNLATLERFRMLKLEIIAAVTSLTSTEGTGLLLGIVDGDYTLAELEAAIESDGPLGPNDQISEELSERFYKWLGAVDRETGTDALFENNQGGHQMEKTIRWTFARTKSWNFFVYNMGSAITTGATVNVRAKSFGVWVT